MLNGLCYFGTRTVHYHSMTVLEMDKRVILIRSSCTNRSVPLFALHYMLEGIGEVCVDDKGVISTIKVTTKVMGAFGLGFKDYYSTQASQLLANPHVAQ